MYTHIYTYMYTYMHAHLHTAYIVFVKFFENIYLNSHFAFIVYLK